MKFIKRLIKFLRNEYSLCHVCENKRGFWVKTKMPHNFNYFCSLFTNNNGEICMECPICNGTGLII